ncbi:toll/interleukin-1 receptor domain-containing protein [Candidatus Poriferisodalis sp.]|uniref:toll/interleukin-1 receptor domain-containing protein n=1 Tax=Candidatus Poriferisodalis sp. TaxID=3101277 RepID=UPI003B524ABD
MLPPVLEVYVVWHPDDAEGAQIADTLLEHFRGTPYSGLVGGAVEVYTRSAPWGPGSDAPRPLPCQVALPHDLPAARVTAVLPVVGVRLARAVEDLQSGWRTYLTEIRAAVDAAPEIVGVFPIRLPGTVDGVLVDVLGDLQELDPESVDDPAVLCREVSQAVAQIVNDPFGDRLTVFISHTKRHSIAEGPDYVDEIVDLVRSTIGGTHLRPYLDAADVLPGSDWDQELRASASSCALLAIRTDLYAGREWCQKEFLTAKRHGMPVVTLNAVRDRDERGSFLMDHVPTVRYDDRDDDSRRSSVEAALNLLVDGALRRAIWNAQGEELRLGGIDWAPPYAPEPATAIRWLLENSAQVTEDDPILVMHPDPPLGPDESDVIGQLFEVAGAAARVDVVTPRTYASRGGGTL